MMKKIYYLLTACIILGSASIQAQNCQALFQHFTTQGNTVQFFDSSFVSPSFTYSYVWDFGDGTIDSSTTIPTHTYSSSGLYVACLTITTNAPGRCVSTYCDTINVGGVIVTPPLNCFYNYNTDTLNGAYFTSHVSGGATPYTYSWNFGNGGSATTANPFEQYNGPGAYGVSMTVTDANGQTCSSYDTVYVNYCQAYFLSNSNPGSGLVSFTNYSAVPRYGILYQWNFGDGSSASAVRNPSHTYTNSGTYMVTLTATDSLNGCTSHYTDSVVINLNTNPPSCNASFVVAKDSSAAYKVILYNTSSNATSHTYQWNFGDGTTGSGRTPQHQYQNFGSYLVCLTITDNQLNCTSTFCDTVGMDSLGNLKSAAGFGIEVRNPISVSVEETMANLSSIEFYPNPANSTVNVQIENLENDVNLTVRDISGKEVVSINGISQTFTTIDVSNLESGFYFITFNDGKNQRTEKLVVSK